MRSTSFYLLSTLVFVCAALFPCSPRIAAAQEPARESLDVARALSSAFEKVAEIINPSMVSVISTKKAKNVTRRNPHSGLRDPFLDPFRDFFGDDVPGLPQIPGPEEFGQGLGTGVIVDDKGHILTNNHVIANADDITVRLNEQSTFKAEVIGRDPKTDLAIIRIKAKGLVPAKFGNSDDLKIGEWVVAAGNPFGLEHSITAGIVSAKGRSIMGGGQFEDFIQTDAAINPGNSGGPLCNLHGEVMGINTAIFSRSGGYMGIGFAIPSNMAKVVIQSLISKGKVVRGWLGVGIQNLTDELAQSFSFSTTEGALVGHIQPGGPAEHSNIRQGDIIIGFNGEKIRNVNQLRNLVAATSPGTKVTLDLIREGQKTSANVAVGELPIEGESPVEEAEADTPSTLDITVESLSPELARRLRTNRTKGVIVTSVIPGGAGAEAGLQPLDIIVSINGREVASVSEFRQLLTKKALQQGVRMVVETQGMQRFVFVKSQE